MPTYAGGASFGGACGHAHGPSTAFRAACQAQANNCLPSPRLDVSEAPRSRGLPLARGERS
eukprot:2826267-Heterocapsa_arctica.AAC.1